MEVWPLAAVVAPAGRCARRNARRGCAMNERERRDIEDRLLEIELARAEAELRNALWKSPSIANSDAPVALGVSQTVWQGLRRAGKGPPTFVIGKRVFVKTRDLRKLIDEQPVREAAP